MPWACYDGYFLEDYNTHKVVHIILQNLETFSNLFFNQYVFKKKAMGILFILF